MRRPQDLQDNAPDGSRKMSFVKELFEFLVARKKYWLMPVVILMALFGGLIVLTKGSAIAPFIYTLF
jgi:hypothetical protein